MIFAPGVVVDWLTCLERLEPIEGFTRCRWRCVCAAVFAARDVSIARHRQLGCVTCRACRKAIRG